mgnify:CR=1 FL=1
MSVGELVYVGSNYNKVTGERYPFIGIVVKLASRKSRSSCGWVYVNGKINWFDIADLKKVKTL